MVGQGQAVEGQGKAVVGQGQAVERQWKVKERQWLVKDRQCSGTCSRCRSCRRVGARRLQSPSSGRGRCGVCPLHWSGAGAGTAPLARPPSAGSEEGSGWSRGGSRVGESSCAVPSGGLGSVIGQSVRGLSKLSSSRNDPAHPSLFVRNEGSPNTALAVAGIDDSSNCEVSDGLCTRPFRQPRAHVLGCLERYEVLTRAWAAGRQHSAGPRVRSGMQPSVCRAA